VGFVWDGLTDSLGDVVRLRALGVVIVLATLAWLVWQLTRRPIPRTLLFPAVLALGAVVSLALTGWRRATITVPSLSRYAYITVVLLLPVVAAALDWLVRRLARAQLAKVVPVVTGVLLVALVIAQVRMFDHYVDGIEEVKQAEKATFLTAAQLVREHHQLLDDHPMYIYEPQVTVGKIAAMDRDGKLPSLDGLREEDRHTVLARVDLVLLPAPVAGLTPDPSRIRLGALHHVDAAPLAGRPECVALTRTRAGGTAQLVTGGGLTVDLLGEGLLGMRITRPDGSAPGDNVYGTLDPAAEQVLSIGPIDGPRDGGAVLLTLPAGTTRVCGVS
jgi:hypothetical protein